MKSERVRLMEYVEENYPRTIAAAKRKLAEAESVERYHPLDDGGGSSNDTSLDDRIAERLGIVTTESDGNYENDSRLDLGIKALFGDVRAAQLYQAMLASEAEPTDDDADDELDDDTDDLEDRVKRALGCVETSRTITESSGDLDSRVRAALGCVD